MHYLLDTNILIAAIKGIPQVRKKLEAISLSEIVLSPVVLGELEHGVEKSQKKQANRERLTRVIAGLQLIPLGAPASGCYGAIRSELERQGRPIGANDYWIAAQALSLGLVLVTDNVREFSRVKGLRIENWLE